MCLCRYSCLCALRVCAVYSQPLTSTNLGLAQVSRVRVPLDAQTLQTMNPNRTAEACERCTTAQNNALQAETYLTTALSAQVVACDAASDAAEAVTVALANLTDTMDEISAKNVQITGVEHELGLMTQRQLEAVRHALASNANVPCCRVRGWRCSQ